MDAPSDAPIQAIAISQLDVKAADWPLFMSGLAAFGLLRATASLTFFPALRASSRDKKPSSGRPPLALRPVGARRPIAA